MEEQIKEIQQIVEIEEVIETEENVEEIRDFLETFKLQNVGFFKYSREEGTRAYSFDNQIDEEIKEIRKDELMKLQMGISLELNKEKIGKKA